MVGFDPQDPAGLRCLAASPPPAQHLAQVRARPPPCPTRHAAGQQFAETSQRARQTIAELGSRWASSLRSHQLPPPTVAAAGVQPGMTRGLTACCLSWCFNGFRQSSEPLLPDSSTRQAATLPCVRPRVLAHPARGASKARTSTSHAQVHPHQRDSADPRLQQGGAGAAEARGRAGAPVVVVVRARGCVWSSAGHA